MGIALWALSNDVKRWRGHALLIVCAFTMISERKEAHWLLVWRRSYMSYDQLSNERQLYYSGSYINTLFNPWTNTIGRNYKWNTDILFKNCSIYSNSFTTLSRFWFCCGHYFYFTFQNDFIYQIKFLPAELFLSETWRTALESIYSLNLIYFARQFQISSSGVISLNWQTLSMYFNRIYSIQTWFTLRDI